MQYDRFVLSPKERIVCIGKFLSIVLIIAWLFYDSFYGGLFFLPFYFVYERREKRHRRIEQISRMRKDFMTSLQYVSTSLSAGMSPENAFSQAADEMDLLLGNKSDIVRELKNIAGQVKNGIRVERLLIDFAKRTRIEEIQDFSIVFSMVGSSGGSYARIINSCVEIMQRSQQTKEEAEILIRGRKYEQKVMNVIPIGILFYLRISSGDFITVLYHNVGGIVVMTVCVIIYACAVLLSEKISEVEI